MINVHYAVQVCDIASRSKDDRYCRKTKTEITQKCISSFVASVLNVSKQNTGAQHNIMFFDDHSSVEVKEFLQRVKEQGTGNVKIDVTELETKGIMPSIRATYEWLENNGKDLVFQVQDDYLFEENAIYEMIDILMQVYSETGTHPLINPFHDNWLWLVPYRMQSTPRAVIPGNKRLWIQCYDLACTFMTTKQQFSQHWDLYEKFFEMGPYNPRLEADSINKILSQRKVLGLMPVNNVALHLQSELEKDPYYDWEKLWTSVKNY